MKIRAVAILRNNAGGVNLFALAAAVQRFGKSRAGCGTNADFPASNSRFSVRTGTVMENSTVSLQKWLFANYLMTSARKGLSSIQLQRKWVLPGKQGGSWSIVSVRLGYRKHDAAGEVEIDETYFGGKEKNELVSKRGNAGRGTFGKAVVIGLRGRRCTACRQGGLGYPHFAGPCARTQILKAGALGTGGPRLALILVNDVNLIFGPSQANRTSVQLTLPELTLPVMLNLVQRGLTDIQTSPTTEMIRGNLMT